MNNSPVVLLQCGDHFENQSRIFALACHLRNMRFQVRPLMYRRASSSRIFEYNGFSTIYLEDYKKGKGDMSLNDEVFIDITSIERAKSPWKFWPSRVAREKERVVSTYFALNELVDHEGVTLIGVWNGYTGYVANSLRVICHNKDISCFFMERSVFSDSLFVDFKGVNGAASICHVDANRVSRIEVLTDLIYRKVKGKNEESFSDPRALILNFNGEYIFLPLQVQTDTNNILYSEHIKTMRQLVLCVLNSILEINKKLGCDLKLVVRRHPEEVDERLNLPNHDSIHYFDSFDIASWCKYSRCVVTINSTVGLEAVTLGVPVVSLGKSIYSNKGVVLEANPSTLKSSLLSVLIDGWVPEHEQVSRYLYMLYEKYTASLDNFPKALLLSYPELFDVSCLGECVSGNIDKRFYAFSKDHIVKVGVICNKVPRLNLTYRKTNEILNSKLIRKKLALWYGHDSSMISIERVAQVDDGFDVLILPEAENTNVIQEFGGILLDEYLLPINEFK